MFICLKVHLADAFVQGGADSVHLEKQTEIIPNCECA